ncbi:MAG TPA: hypothetical protein PLU79_21245, partial [Burkholderiaceae bacterium]|nr:hypothetical protein [Burkholderiaceae bacterium]
IQQLAQIGKDGCEHTGLQVIEFDMESQHAQYISPQMIGGATAWDRLAAHHQHSVDQCEATQFFEEP